MTRAAQAALFTITAVLLVLSGLYVGISRQQQKAAERTSCVNAVRTEWEISLGSVFRYGLRHPRAGIPNRLIDPYDHAQQRMETMQDGKICMLEHWWQP